MKCGTNHPAENEEEVSEWLCDNNTFITLFSARDQIACLNVTRIAWLCRGFWQSVFGNLLVITLVAGRQAGHRRSSGASAAPPAGDGEEARRIDALMQLFQQSGDALRDDKRILTKRDDKRVKEHPGQRCILAG